jgi:hypothetical protein
MYAPTPQELVGQMIRDFSETRSAKSKTFLQLRLRPRPWWLPTAIWRWLLARLLLLEYFPELDPCHPH